MGINQFFSFHVLFPFLLFLFMVVKFVGKSKTINSTPKLPPGPWKLPIIGNLHQLVGSPPHHLLRELAKKYGPLMHLQLGELSTVVVSSPEMAKEVMKTHDIIFANRPFHLVSWVVSYKSSNIAFSPCGNYWRQLKKVCVMELLSEKRVQTFQSIREAEVASLIKTISSCEGSPVNLSDKIFSMTYSITSKAAFGKKYKDQKSFIATMKKLWKLAGGYSMADLYPSIKMLQVITGIRAIIEKLHQETDRVLDSIVCEHKQIKMTTKNGNKEEVFLDFLLKLQQHGDLGFPLTDDNIKAVILDMFSAGSDTSSTTVEWAMSEMVKNPRVMKKAQAEVRQVFDRKGNVDEERIHELKFLKLVIKETLRLHPPVPLLLPREFTESCQINGYGIRVKTKAIVNAWAIGRDPMYWSEAETFWPERFLNSSTDFKEQNFEFIPFGSGRRICPGISFAIPNIELPLAQLLYHFDWKLANGLKHEDLDMTESDGISARRKEDLILIPTRYHPLSVK